MAVIKSKLKIFSGRPNPQWDLTTEDIPDLEAILKRLPRCASPFQAPPDLGYRGIALMNTDPSGAWTDIIVYHEQVTVCTRSAVQYLIDEKCAIENMLLRTASPHVSEAILETIPDNTLKSESAVGSSSRALQASAKPEMVNHPTTTAAKAKK